MNKHERSGRPHLPVTPAVLRRHGLLVVTLGWLTLLAAMLCWLLIGPPAGMILAIVFLVLGVVKIVLGASWRNGTKR